MVQVLDGEQNQVLRQEAERAFQAGAGEDGKGDAGKKKKVGFTRRSLRPV